LNKAPENLIETLKKSLQQSRNAENRLRAELENSNISSEEVGRLNQEIMVFQGYSTQIEYAIKSLSN
jgi:hypothetical protein